jgi:hypothetical protein
MNEGSSACFQFPIFSTNAVVQVQETERLQADADAWARLPQPVRFKLIIPLPKILHSIGNRWCGGSGSLGVRTAAGRRLQQAHCGERGLVAAAGYHLLAAVATLGCQCSWRAASSAC